MPLYLGRFSYTPDAIKALLSSTSRTGAPQRGKWRSHLAASSWASGTPLAR